MASYRQGASPTGQAQATGPNPPSEGVLMPTALNHRPLTEAAVVRTASDVALLVARIGLGVIMVAHAKLSYDFGGGSLAGVGQLFDQAGVPLAAITGPANVLFELVGGIAMILGVAVRI